MNKIDTLLSARWVIPIVPRNKILENYSVAVEKGQIIDLLPTKKALKKYTTDNHLSLVNHVLMPGLVNAHTHASMNLFRGLAEDLPLLDWLEHHIWPVEQAIICGKTVQTGIQFAMAEMIRGGTTYFNNMYFYPLDAAEMVIQTGMRSTAGLTLMNIPTHWAKNETEYLKKAKAAYSNRPESDLINWLITPHATFTNSDKGLFAAKELSDQYNLNVHMHAHETLGEIALEMKQSHCRPLERIAKAGLLNDKLSLAHMVHLNNDEIVTLKENRVHVVHCPESNMKLGSGLSNMYQLSNKGINIALGTDGAASNNDLDMFGEMRSAAFMAKGITQDPTVFPAYQVLEMATINGAKAFGLEEIIGSLEKGKSADIISIDLSHYFTQPIYDLAALLVYAASRFQVTNVWVKGKQLLSQGELTTIDIEKVMAEVTKLAKKIRKFGP